MGTMSESENYSLANPGEASSVAENGPKVLVDANIISATLHYSVVMTQDGNIRVKDSYCDSKEVSETYFQRPPHIFMMLLFSNRADEQILLDLIDFVMDGIMKAEAMAAKKCARLASKALLALKRSRSPPPKTKASADCGSPIQKKLKSERKSISAETQLSAVLWVNTNRPASKHRDWYPLLVAYWMSGKEPTFTGQPVPLYNTVYQWLQRHASRELAGRLQKDHGSAAADEVNPNPSQLPITGGAAASNHSGLTCVLAAALKHILRYLCDHHQYRTIIEG